MKRSVTAVCAALLATFILTAPAAADLVHPVAIPAKCNGSLDGCNLNWLERNAVRVLNDHFVAFGEGDLDEVMSHYSNWSVIITQNGIFVGKQQIRQYYIELMSLFGGVPSADSSFVVDLTRVQDSTIYYTYHASAAVGVNATFGADTLVVVGNKFLLHTTALVLEFPQP